MPVDFEAEKNYQQTRKTIGYLEKDQTGPEEYLQLGFRCGLEIHQQLKTAKKLFCRCPAGLYQQGNDFDAEIIRHMRPTLSELGEYDGTALMEFKTRKNITYRIKNNSACTYDIDDTPPFPLNREALEIALEIALLLKTSIVGELHITRKQYLDGSIPTGFQRTGILGINGQIPIKNRKIGIIQLSIEEDACREISDIGHERIYTTDRLGMPLVETVTYPDMRTPDEAAEAAHYLRFLTRSTEKVRTGIGAARQDVNVSIKGGTRVEIKGVAHISWIPELTHNEAFRQKALLEIKNILNQRIKKSSDWQLCSRDITDRDKMLAGAVEEFSVRDRKIVAVNLPDLKGILSFFLQPGRIFADELSDRLKVVACLEKPNMIHSESLKQPNRKLFKNIKSLLAAKQNDAQLIFWGPEEDINTALETIEERCRQAFRGIPNETRKALKNGNNIFERVLPGPDRMYPDTDSAPIAIDEDLIEKVRKSLPQDIEKYLNKLREWKIPADTHTYILKKNLFPLIKKIVADFDESPVFVATLFGHKLKNLEGRLSANSHFKYSRIYDLFVFITDRNLKSDIIKQMLPIVCQHPDRDFDSVLTAIEYKKISREKLLASIARLKRQFQQLNTSNNDQAESLWLMGKLRPLAVGNVDLKDLRMMIAGEKND